jgi:hypothetical protein
MIMTTTAHNKKRGRHLNFLTTEEVRLITFGLLYELVKYLMLIIFFRLKKKFKIALEENPLVIPGKDLRETS